MLKKSNLNYENKIDGLNSFSYIISAFLNIILIAIIILIVIILRKKLFYKKDEKSNSKLIDINEISKKVVSKNFIKSLFFPKKKCKNGNTHYKKANTNIKKHMKKNLYNKKDTEVVVNKEETSNNNSLLNKDSLIQVKEVNSNVFYNNNINNDNMNISSIYSINNSPERAGLKEKEKENYTNNSKYNTEEDSNNNNDSEHTPIMLDDSDYKIKSNKEKSYIIIDNNDSTNNNSILNIQDDYVSSSSKDKESPYISKVNIDYVDGKDVNIEDEENWTMV